MSVEIAVVCSVQREADPLLEHLEGRADRSSAAGPSWTGRIGDSAVLCVVGGMGKANGAHAVASICHEGQPGAIIGFGIGGAFPRSGLQIRDVAIATAEIYADEGTMTPDGWLSCEGIGIPLLRTSDGTKYFNQFPVDPEISTAAAEVAARTDAGHAAGHFLTVSTCSGTRERSDELWQRFGGICETMEGAAYAHMAARYGVRYAEIRGISNIVEDRDPSVWRIDEAAAASADLVATLIYQLQSENFR